MPITLVEVGSSWRIKRLQGDDAVRRHLGDLGFVEGASVTVVAELAGSLVLGIHETRVALNRDLAARILV